MNIGEPGEVVVKPDRREIIKSVVDLGEFSFQGGMVRLQLERVVDTDGETELFVPVFSPLSKNDSNPPLASRMRGDSDNMKVNGDMKINSLFGNFKGEDDDSPSAVDDLVFGTLSSMGVEIGAKFSFETKMDRKAVLMY